jgi:pimeloyl-ACP methyl ester carboxylesterase
VIIGGIEGRRDIVSRLRSQSLRCPSQKFALVGYSQGASIMHRAAEEIPSYLYSKIVAIAMFGDPDLRSSRPVGWPAALRPKVLQSCAPGDPVSLLRSLLTRWSSILLTMWCFRSI